MSTNEKYTFNYYQPDEYRFSLDSVFLAQKVALLEEENKRTTLKVLDLCSGCGIIGLELSLHLKKKLYIDFLEIQKIYQDHFEQNLKMVYPSIIENSNHYKFLNLNYNSLLSAQHENSYDLLISNPPYFLKNEGLLSPSDFKNRCRFFLDSDFKTLFDSIIWVLKPNCSAFILVRSGVHHGRSPITEINKIIESKGRADIIDNIRGTDIIEIKKNP
jgi:tRNA1Val (adenine37-N6)-methyltransferase